MKNVLLLLLRAYKLGVSPFLGQNCRFYPSCSDYASEAIHVHGALRGSALAAGRLCKCHPWHAGGCDPVPPKKTDVGSAPAAETNAELHAASCSATESSPRLTGSHS